jgi:hypothetical protein
MRLALAVAGSLLLAALAAGAARADGDPASDVLPTERVYLPVTQPSADAAAALAKSVAAVYAGGDRIKVAVIATLDDMGSVPMLFNQPQEYARFLGVELSGFYVGPLLVAMPGGYGYYDGGRPTAAATGALAGIAVNRSSVDALVRAAAAAVDRLAAASALHSQDVKAPTPYTSPATVTLGKAAALRFRLFDDSERASATITVSSGKRTLATLKAPLQQAVYANVLSVTWHVPKAIPQALRRRLRVCVVATDPSGNRSAPNCLPIGVRKKG